VAQLTQTIYQDLSRGSNVVTNPYLIGKQQSVLLTNALLDEHGSIRTRDGSLIQTSSPDVAPNIRPIVKLYDFIRADGRIFPLAMIRGNTGAGNELYNRGTLTLPIVAVAPALQQFRVVGDQRVYFQQGDPFIIMGSTGNDGAWIVDHSTLEFGGTVIFVTSTIPSVIPDGNIIRVNVNTAWALIGILGTNYAIPDILTFVNEALIVNGAETPWQYDGTTLSPLTDQPGTGQVPVGGFHHALHQGFYWLWNTARGTSTPPGGGGFASLTTALGVANADLKFTAKTAGAAGNNITVQYALLVGGTLLQVSVFGTAISVIIDTGAGPAATAAQIGAAINASPEAAALVTAANAPGNDGSGVPPVMAATALSGGAAGPPGTSSFDGPSSLRSSDLNNPNSWPLANQIFVDKDDGDQGMGMGQFTIAESGISPTTSQILFKAFRSYQMTGVFGSTNPAFAIQKIKSDMGCVAPRTIRFAPGFGLIRLSHRGFALFDGVDDKLISEEVRPLIFGNPIYTALNWAAIDQSYGVVVANPPFYVAACPVGDSGLTRVFCYDLVRRGWTILQFPFAIATLQAIEDPGQLPVVLEGDFNQGKVRRLFNDQDTTDDGVEVTAQALLHPVSGSSPQANSYFRRAVLKLADVRAGQTVDCLYIVGPVVKTPPQQIQKQVTVPVTVGLGLGFGLQPFGTSPFGGLQINSEVDLTVDLGVIGTNLRPQYSWTGRLRLRGVEYHQKGKPLRRVSVFQ
jgi:hypothetical protein